MNNSGYPKIIILVFLLLFLTSCNTSPSINQDYNSYLQNLDSQELEDEKLRQEIHKLEIENTNLQSPWQRISFIATIVTIAGAISGTFITIWKQFSEKRKDRELRETESKRRMDEKLSSLITDLSSANKSLKLSAIISSLTFLNNDYPEYHEQLYLLLLSNLKIEEDKDCRKLLIQVFEKAVQLYLQKKTISGKDKYPDFSGAFLYRINLENLDLAYADIAFADLRFANFRNANLYRVKGYKANLQNAKLTNANLNEARLKHADFQNAQLHDAKLHSSNLKEVNFTNAEFYRAELQSAHFENAKLQDACFEQANLNDAYFLGATFSEQTLRSIKKALYWQKAHFDEKTIRILEEL